jgi:hypothetical protein
MIKIATVSPEHHGVFHPAALTQQGSTLCLKRAPRVHCAAAPAMDYYLQNDVQVNVSWIVAVLLK